MFCLVLVQLSGTRRICAEAVVTVGGLWGSEVVGGVFLCTLVLFSNFSYVSYSSSRGKVTGVSER